MKNMPNNILDLHIFTSIDKDKGTTYRLRFLTNHMYNCELGISEKSLAKLMVTVNDLLEQIVLDNSIQYEQKIQIDKDVCQQDLDRIGTELNLLDTLFFQSDRRDDPETNRAYEELKAICKKSLTLRIISDRNFVFPWALVYDGPHIKKQLNPNSFWGFKHVIQQIPVKNFDDVPISSNDLEIGFNIAEKIDEPFETNWVQLHEQLANEIQKAYCVTFNRRDTEEKVRNAFAQDTLSESIIYFYCHAKFSVEGRERAYDSYLKLTTPENKLTLGDLYYDAEGPGGADTFSRYPLVFINACQSAALSPAFYEGFVPYFLLKGARGIVGTISKIPGVFASEFAVKFFKRLVVGEQVDKIISQLRQENLAQNHNILGLYYVSFCDLDFAVKSIQVRKGYTPLE
jgi:CHAT domain